MHNIYIQRTSVEAVYRLFAAKIVVLLPFFCRFLIILDNNLNSGSTMLVLYETAAGYAIFKLLDEKKIKNVDNIWEEFSTAEKAQEK